jgi:hypothetical protein
MERFRLDRYRFVGTGSASEGPSRNAGRLRLHNFLIAFFAMTAGFTASGICANLYRLLVKDTGTSLSRAVYVAVMIFAGPNVLFESAAKAWREKSCSGVGFWLAAALAGYWSLALGMLVIQVGLALKAL